MPGMRELELEGAAGGGWSGKSRECKVRGIVQERRRRYWRYKQRNLEILSSMGRASFSALLITIPYIHADLKMTFCTATNP
eukprot:755161-Hanusia_phi.AAC.6